MNTNHQYKPQSNIYKVGHGLTVSLIQTIFNYISFILKVDAVTIR